MTFHVQYDDGGIEKFVRSDWIMLDSDWGGGGKASAEEGSPKAADDYVSDNVGDGNSSPEQESKPAIAEAAVATKKELSEKESEDKALDNSVNTQFPNLIFVRRWTRSHVKAWITKIVKLPGVAEKFFEKRMDGEMIVDRNWTSGDMERDLSHPTEGMGISDAQERAKISAFIKALRERDENSRNARISNYYAVWGDDSDENADDSFESDD